MGATSSTGTGSGSAISRTTSQLEKTLALLPQKFSMSFTNSSLTGGVLTVTHNLGNKYVAAYNVYDGNDRQIVPDNIQVIDRNTLAMTFSSLLPIVGIWNLIVVG